MSNPIGWCDCTVNPIVGCTKCSHGCENCYAERFAARLAKNPATAKKYAGVVDERGRWTGKVSEPDWTCFARLPKAPRRVFVGSMTDFFYEKGLSNLGALFCTMDSMPQHTFLLLTKRPEQMRCFQEAFVHVSRGIPRNIWLGVTICNQEEAIDKIPTLLDTPASKRFLSVEPMLGPVDLTRFLPGLDWVICGGETGNGARPMHPDWVRSLRDQCVEAGVPFYFKGWGCTKKTPALLDGREWREFPAQEVSR